MSQHSRKAKQLESAAAAVHPVAADTVDDAVACAAVDSHTMQLLHIRSWQPSL